MRSRPPLGFLVDNDGTVRGAWAYEDGDVTDLGELIEAARALSPSSSTLVAAGLASTCAALRDGRSTSLAEGLRGGPARRARRPSLGGLAALAPTAPAASRAEPWLDPYSFQPEVEPRSELPAGWPVRRRFGR